nr:DEAD/DEAH box helicase [Qipengyuania xiapuensis]
MVERYASFSRSFSRIRSQEIADKIDAVYESGKFWPDPLITINPRFEKGGSIDQLVKEGVLDPALEQIFAFGKERKPITLHRHQERAVIKARAKESFVVTTGTGSGKSLCFFVPIIDAIVRAKRDGEAPKTRAIIIYPMNALANSQLGEIQKFAEDAGIPEELKPTVARYTGQESEDERKAIAEQKPDIILTNFMMLELLMTRQYKLDQKVIENSIGLDFLVLDELHTYRGRQGADVAMLVRRVKERLAPKKHLICIGTSATMSSSPDEVERAKRVSEVATKLFGQPVAHENVIDELLERATCPEIKPATLGAKLVQAIKEELPNSLTDEELYNHPLACWVETEIGLDDGEKLRRRKPITLKEAAEKLAKQTGEDEKRCESVLAQMLGIMGTPEKDRGGDGDRAFLAFKLHRFISGAGQAYVTLENAKDRRIALEGQKYHPDDEEARLYPMFFCRECGQEVLSVTYGHDEDGAMRMLARPIDEPASDEPDAGGDESGYLVPAVNDDFDFAGNPEDYPEGWQETTASGEIRLTSSHRGKHEGQHLYLKLDGSICGEHDGGTPAWFFRGPYRFCPHCGHQPASQARERNKLAGLSAEGRSSATTLIVASVLSWMDQDASLRKYSRKLLGFTDNRQDAALQAGHFNDFIFVSLLRGAIYRAVAEAGESGLKPSQFGDAVRRALGFDLELEDRLPDWMRDPKVKGYGKRQGAQETLAEVLAHRLWADLRKGWRFTNPNLEDVGLVDARFMGLSDLAKDEEEYADCPRLAELTPEKREQLFEILFDAMRQSLAVSTPALDRERIRQMAEESDGRLKLPWAIDPEEIRGLRESGMLMIEVPKRARISAADSELILRAGDRSNLAKAIRDKSIWGEKLGRDDYEEVIKGLLSAAESHEIVRRVQSGFELPAWRLAPTNLRLFAKTNETENDKHNQFFRTLYQGVAATLAQDGPLQNAFEGREHTAQVDSDVREWREQRFRFEEKDQSALAEEKDKLFEAGEPSDFLPAMFCSPTMELGVDISALNVVYMRNVPPTPANYAQRSGRAGRSGHPALVVTYCAAQSPHDQYYFADTAALVSGVVRPPALDLANQDLLTSHLQAEWLASVEEGLEASIRENLDMDKEGMPLKAPIRAAAEEASNSRRARPVMRRLIDAMLGDIEPSDAPWLDDVDAFVDQVNDLALENFEGSFDRWRNLYESAREEQDRAHAIQQKTGLQPGERRAAKNRYVNATKELEVLERGHSKYGSDFYVYRYLATEGFLPGYNFPRLPLYAFVPADKTSVLQRPRFLAIAEFGPNALIYHEGRAYRVTKAKLPAESRGDDGKLSTNTLILCGECGAGHKDPLQERCHACKSSLAGVERIDTVFRIDNVETSPSLRITANDEDRQRRGFEILTIFQWPTKDGVPQIRGRTIGQGGNSLLHLDYGPATTLSRLNKGLRRRKSKSILGFFIDPQTGRWIKDPSSGDSDEGMGDPGNAPPQRIVPIVEDHKNAMLLRPVRNFRPEQMATLQHALLRGIQTEFELEEGELLGEPLPTRVDRNCMLLYEATEGGAGVLNRLVSDPTAIASAAARALKLMHYLEPFGDKEPEEHEESCVAGCYRCLLSYYNQPDHELIDRRDAEVVEYLIALSQSVDVASGHQKANGSQGSSKPDNSDHSGWHAAFERWDVQEPKSLDIGGDVINFYWPARDVLAVIGEATEATKQLASARGILDLVELPAEPGEEPPASLKTALGIL